MQPLHGGIHHNRALLANKTLISKQYILFRTNYCTLTLITSKSHNALCRSDIQAFVLFKHLSYSSICPIQASVLFKHLSYSSICGVIHNRDFNALYICRVVFIQRHSALIPVVKNHTPLT